MGDTLAEINEKFIPNYEDAKSNDKAIYKGKFYRITILSETLIRLEYDAGGVFEDRPTEFAKFRNFPVPKFEVQENETIIVISTPYFRLQYQKDKPFIGTMFAQDSNLKVALQGTEKLWYYGHDEARNFGGFNNILETLDIKKSIDGFYKIFNYIAQNVAYDENGIDAIFPKWVLGDAQPYEFIDRSFPGVEHSHEYLTINFGDDYMQLPPVEKRVFHRFYHVDFHRPDREVEVKELV